MIAVGSEPVCLPNLAFDEKQIVSSTGALSLERVPERLVVVGAGYIGLEMGSVWSRLGSSVTVVEFLDNIVPNVDLEVAKHFHRNLQKQGLNFMLGTKVIQVDLNDKGVALLAESVNGGSQQKIDCDVVLVAVGRKPSTDNLGLEELGVKRDKNGFLCVNDKLETSCREYPSHWRLYSWSHAGA